MPAGQLGDRPAVASVDLLDREAVGIAQLGLQRAGKQEMWSNSFARLPSPAG